MPEQDEKIFTQIMFSLMDTFVHSGDLIIPARSPSAVSESIYHCYNVAKSVIDGPIKLFRPDTIGSFSLISEPILHYVPSEKSTPAPIDSLDGRWSLSIRIRSQLRISTYRKEEELKQNVQNSENSTTFENDQERRRCEGNKREGDEDQQFEVDEDIEGEYEQTGRGS
ncbi:hypothetical protein BLNAU_2863 [Blattamonas nauphoetae]|uniref:Uncharacterized protein n=1 Tax=Blattamonas nauphoetae TaxID=2049346 RepID=A0ABQ9YEM4_9EUKA|nr:hypothetical protein BLNAU_2863 [Blattamonas nauphoetae]